MKLKILNIESFIQNKNIKEVKSTKEYSDNRRQTFENTGLFSETIFGKQGSRERRKTFGYIDIKIEMIHPEVFKILTSIDTDLTKYILNSQKYIIKNGKLVQDKNGKSGIINLIKNFKNINFDLFNKKSAEWINMNKSNIFISKFLVLPAGIRDIYVDIKTHKTIIQYAEINDLYLKLIRQTNNLPIFDINKISDEEIELFEEVIQSIQRILLDINDWIKKRMSGKYGLVRGGILNKVVDFSARLVIIPNLDIQLGYIGLPYHIILKLFEPFTIYHILLDKKNQQLIQSFLGITKEIDSNDIRLLINQISTNPYSMSPQLHEYLFNISNKIAETNIIIYKRDPVENRDSFIGARLTVLDENSFTASINPLDLTKNTGDFDGDTIAVYAVLTEEAKDEVIKNMLPTTSKSMWNMVGSLSKTAYTIELDAAAAIYSATKN